MAAQQQHNIATTVWWLRHGGGTEPVGGVALLKRGARAKARNPAGTRLRVKVAHNIIVMAYNAS